MFYQEGDIVILNYLVTTNSTNYFYKSDSFDFDCG